MKLKFLLTVLATTLSFSAISHALSLPPNEQPGSSVITPSVSLPPEEQSPPLEAQGKNLAEYDERTIQIILPKLASLSEGELKQAAKSLTAQEKAALYKTAMLARKVLIEAQSPTQTQR